jgi:hypothetical protein
MKYQIKVTFESDIELSEYDLETLEGMVALQIEEPTDFQGEELELVLRNVGVSSKVSE